MTVMPPGAPVPWAPEDLPVAAETITSWGYVVVEEIVDDVALLRRWSWPLVDPLGRLLWPEGAEHSNADAAVDLSLLESQLYAPNGIERDPRCGDTFAVPPATDEHGRSGHAHDVRTLLGDGDVFDISADAHEAAKIAYQSSVGAIQPGHTASEQAQTGVKAVLLRRTAQRLQPMRVFAPPHAEGG